MESDPKKIRDGNARMFFELQKEQKDKRLQEEKKKEKKRKDRLRYLIQKEAKGTLSEEENMEKMELQNTI